MIRRLALLMAVALMLCIGYSRNGSAKSSGDRTDTNKAVTFSKDVAPILQKQCVVCHRPDGMAPMSLMTYKEVRPWAKAIREKVVERDMPPWHADSHYGDFANERRLSQPEIDTIKAWVDGGVLRGDDKDLPPPVSFSGSWRIGQPDVVLTMAQEHTLEAQGPDEYQYFIIPTNFKEDRWVQAAEALPGNKQIVHHIIAFIQQPRGMHANKMQQARSGNPPLNKEIIFYKDGTLMRVSSSAPVFNNGCTTPEGGAGIFKDGTGTDPMPALLCGVAPGRDADIWPAGFAKRLPAGAQILLQVHYSKVGTVEKDRSSVGIIFAKEPPKREVFTEPIRNHFFEITAGADNHEVTACHTFAEDVHFVSLMPHMHLRGKDMQIKAVYPDGKSDILLRVPKYSFSWQTTYYLRKPVAIPKGTRVEVMAHFDNSSKNKENPDPTKTIRWGDPTYDEMMIGWVDFYRDGQQPIKSTSTANIGNDNR